MLTLVGVPVFVRLRLRSWRMGKILRDGVLTEGKRRERNGSCSTSLHLRIPASVGGLSPFYVLLFMPCLFRSRSFGQQEMRKPCCSQV